MGERKAKEKIRAYIEKERERWKKYEGNPYSPPSRVTINTEANTEDEPKRERSNLNINTNTNMKMQDGARRRSK
jgi:hypothetical protein